VFNAIRIGLLAAIVIGVIVGLTMGLIAGVDMGLVTGVVIGMYFGGFACIQHLILRFMLWHSGAMPRDYARFLDYCAERIFLRKVGGGYIFIHRMLMEYFASLDSNTISQITEQAPQSEI
jgi:hypothetical protein